MELLMQSVYMEFFLILVTLCSLYKIVTHISTCECLNIFEMSRSFFKMSWKEIWEAFSQKKSEVINVRLMTAVQMWFMVFCIYNAVVIRDIYSIASGVTALWMLFVFGFFKLVIAFKYYREYIIEEVGSEETKKNLDIFVIFLIHHRKFSYYVLFCMLCVYMKYYYA